MRAGRCACAYVRRRSRRVMAAQIGRNRRAYLGVVLFALPNEGGEIVVGCHEVHVLVRGILADVVLRAWWASTPSCPPEARAQLGDHHLRAISQTGNAGWPGPRPGAAVLGKRDGKRADDAGGSDRADRRAPHPVRPGRSLPLRELAHHPPGTAVTSPLSALRTWRPVERQLLRRMPTDPRTVRRGGCV